MIKVITKGKIHEVTNLETGVVLSRTLDEDSARFAAKAAQAKLDLANHPAERIQVASLPASDNVLERVNKAIAASKSNKIEQHLPRQKKITFPAPKPVSVHANDEEEKSGKAKPLYV